MIKLASCVKIKAMHGNGNPLFLFLLLLLVLSQDACYSQATKRPEYVAGEVLVKFKANVSLAEAKSLHRRLGSKILKHFERINVDLVKIREG